MTKRCPWCSAGWIKEDGLAPRHKCPDCNGTGFIEYCDDCGEEETSCYCYDEEDEE